MFDSLLFLIITSYLVNGEVFRIPSSAKLYILKRWSIFFQQKYLLLFPISTNVPNGDKNNPKYDDMGRVMGLQNCFAFFRFSFDGFGKWTNIKWTNERIFVDTLSQTHNSTRLHAYHNTAYKWFFFSISTI